MPRARKHIVCVSETPYYHITSRCVRRAFLCGKDAVSGKSYEHRRQWIEDRIRVLSSLFSVEICAYAVMSNHYHLVVRLIPHEVENWSDADVLERWTSLFKGPLLIQRYRGGESLLAVEEETVRDIIKLYRRRLASLSWFMKCLNEPIARKANMEDQCTGHFWEARFHSQPLLSERALLAAMAYVDLNPVRAGIAESPEASDFTSIKVRLKSHSNPIADSVSRLLNSGELRQLPSPVRPLARFADSVDRLTESAHCLPMRESDYMALVDSTGRVASKGKRFRISPKLQPILQRLGLTESAWVENALNFRQRYWRGDVRTALAS